MVVQLPPKPPRPVVKAISRELDEIDEQCKHNLKIGNVRGAILLSRKWVDLARRGGLLQ